MWNRCLKTTSQRLTQDRRKRHREETIEDKLVQSNEHYRDRRSLGVGSVGDRAQGTGHRARGTIIEAGMQRTLHYGVVSLWPSVEWSKSDSALERP